MELVFEHHVPLPREIVFAFHENPRNLELILAGWKSFRLMHCNDSIAPGAEVWLEETALGILPVALGYRHVQYEPPEPFGETLIHGPFSKFTHMHEFDDDGNNGTIVRDRLDIAVPWHYGGTLTLQWLIVPRIRQVFALRGRTLQRLAADGTIMRAVHRCHETMPETGEPYRWKLEPGFSS